nr:hypothetical protein BaRGS_016187 [Batillaria attramentaria]
MTGVQQHQQGAANKSRQVPAAEKARQRNRHEERRLKQELDRKHGMRETHEYRMRVMREERQLIEKELGKIRMDIHRKSIQPDSSPTAEHVQPSVGELLETALRNTVMYAVKHGENLQVSDDEEDRNSDDDDDDDGASVFTGGLDAMSSDSPNFDPEHYNPDGSLRTVHKMPDFNTSYDEASKARYIRHRKVLDREKELSVNEVFEKP